MNPTLIDFLPASYNQNRLRYQKKLWHRGVAGVFLFCIVLGTIQQQRLRMILTTKRTEMQAQAQQIVKQLGSPAALQKQIEQLDAKANLVTFLRLRIPPTQILATIANHLPTYVTLTEIACRQEQAREPLAQRGRTPVAAPKAEKKTDRMGAVDDLERLREERKKRAENVLVSGIAPNDGAIAEFLSGLQSDRLFQEVELVFAEEYQMQEQPVRRFQVRLVLRNWKLPQESSGSTSAAHADLRERAL